MKDSWEHLRQRTPARVALGRAGAALPTAELIAFAADHAAARDAVWAELDTDQLAADLTKDFIGPNIQILNSAAESRALYLQRPDLGRRLADNTQLPPTTADLSITLADGLSATATQRHAPTLLHLLLPKLTGLTLAPLTIVTQARVGIQDDIGSRLAVKLSLILLGERPGLSSADSLGAYLVYHPGPTRTDADRNCVSNIRPNGLPLESAAETIAHLIHQSLTRGISGVSLKDERPRLQTPREKEDSHALGT